MSTRKRKRRKVNTLKDDILIERYLEWKKSDVSPRTLRQYRFFLQEFEKFMNKRGKALSQLLKEDLSAFIQEQREKGNSSVSIKPKYYNIKGFVKWLYFRDILSEKHYREFLEDKYRLEKNKSTTKALTPEEVNLVYKKISDPQLRMIFWVGENYGLRASEYAELQVQHINLKKKDPYLEIHGKGDKIRKIAILEEDIEHWKTWLKILSGYDLDHDYVFFTSRGKSSYTAINRYYNKMSEIVHPLPEHLHNDFFSLTREKREEYKEFKKKYWFTAHDLRRTFATITRTVKKVDLDLVQDALGHESVITTQKYLRERERVSRQRYREQLRNNSKIRS